MNINTNLKKRVFFTGNKIQKSCLKTRYKSFIFVGEEKIVRKKKI